MSLANRYVNLPNLLETKARKTVYSQQTTQAMLMRQCSGFVFPNLKTEVEETATINHKHIGSVIEDL